MASRWSVCELEAQRRGLGRDVIVKGGGEGGVPLQRLQREKRKEPFVQP